MSGRLRPFEFLLARGDELLTVWFYAASESAALRMAVKWALPRGWSVEGGSA